MCVQECPRGYLETQGICEKCEVDGCERCDFKERCEECRLGYFMFEGQCIEECREGYFPNNLLRICQNCTVENCLRCMSTQECLKCRDGYIYEPVQ